MKKSYSSVSLISFLLLLGEILSEQDRNGPYLMNLVENINMEEVEINNF